MQKPFRVVPVSVVSVLMLLFTPWLCSQEAGGKDPADKGVAEQKTVEKTPVHPFGERCDPTICMTKVLYFSNLSQPNELQDVVNALRTTVDISRVQQLLFAQVLVVRGTPEQVASAEKLANELDMAKRRFGGVGYRLDFKIISESDGGQKPRSRIYSLVTEAHETAKLNIGRQQPAHGQSDDSSETSNLNLRILSPDGVSNPASSRRMSTPLTCMSTWLSQVPPRGSPPKIKLKMRRLGATTAKAPSRHRCDSETTSQLNLANQPSSPCSMIPTTNVAFKSK
jgi:hypothetical protein